jgi:epoxyqueuosine reductase
MADLTARVKSIARDLGFSFCGVAKAGFLEEEAPRLEQWLAEGKHGTMHWMENHFDKRLDPRILVPGAKSVVSVLYNYFPDCTQHDPEAPKISRYAYGEDYHDVIRDRLKEFLHRIREQAGDVQGRVFVDSAPVMDKAWAARAGLGWQGKHTNLISKGHGSWFFIAELILDLQLEPDGPVTDHCGTCTACIDACPTDAIIAPYVLDASKCISYLTIELREAIPEEFKGRMDGWAFGCDVCQEVCPWNRFSAPHSEPRFAQGRAPELTAREWKEMSREVFSEVFAKSAVKRTKYEGLMRNVRFLGESGC